MTGANPLVAPGCEADYRTVDDIVFCMRRGESCHGGQNKAFPGPPPNASTVDGVSRGGKKVYN